MSNSDIPDLRTAELDDEEISTLFREQGFGVLSLAVENTAYSVPMSFGYDGERLYFVYLQTTDESTKIAFSDQTELASFIVCDIESKHHWRSAIAYGPLSELDEESWNPAVQAVKDNAWHPNLFASASPMQGLQWWELTPEEYTGRKSTEYE